MFRIREMRHSIERDENAAATKKKEGEKSLLP